MPTPLPPNPMPKQEFQTSESACKKLLEVVNSPAFRQGVQVALLQYQRKLTGREGIDGNLAAASFMKLQGAQEFVEVLIELPIITTAPAAKQDPTKLNYKA